MSTVRVAVDRFQYLLLLAGCLVITLPLELVLGARVWRRPRRLLAALLPVAVVFTVYDVVAIAGDWWTYSDEYTTGWELPGNYPVEELAFFLVIPICSILTLEGVRAVLRRFER